MTSQSQTAFVLGAGFSHALYEACPLTDDLGEVIRQHLTESERTTLPAGAFEHGRFEEWLSYRTEDQPHLTREENAGARLLAMKIVRLIHEHLAEVQADALLSEPPVWFWELLSVLHVLRAEVVTLNYDNFVECGVQSLTLQAPSWGGSSTVCESDILDGQPPCGDFSRASSQEGSDLRGPLYNEDDHRANTFKLLKLHGSLSWFWLPDSGRGDSSLIRWTLPGRFREPWDQDEPLRRRKLPNHEVFVVPPATGKGALLHDPVTAGTWRRAAAALRRADRIVLLGYSVPQADTSLSVLLSDAVRGRDVQVTIVDRRPSPVQARLGRLGVSRDNIDLVGGEGCIARWVRAEISRLKSGVVAQLQRDTRLIGDVLVFSDGPRVERFRSVEARRGSPLTLHLVPRGEQCARPVMYDDLRHRLDTATSLKVESDGASLPVIAHWVREDGSGALMTQLHLVTTRTARD